MTKAKRLRRPKTKVRARGLSPPSEGKGTKPPSEAKDVVKAKAKETEAKTKENDP